MGTPARRLLWPLGSAAFAARRWTARPTPTGTARPAAPGTWPHLLELLHPPVFQAVRNGDANPGKVLVAHVIDGIAARAADAKDFEREFFFQSCFQSAVGGRGGGQGANALSFENNAQFYSPPYLFQGPRPTISGALAAATYGQTLRIDVPSPASISELTLLPIASVTHAFDFNNRFISLGRPQVQAGQLVADLPRPDASSLS